MRVRTLGAALLVALVAIVAACGGDAQGNALDDFCNSVSEVEAAIQGITSLDPATATTDDLEAAVDELRSAGDQAVEAAQDLEEANADALSAAIDEFGATISELPEDTSLEEGIAAVGASFTAITAEVDNIRAQSCAETEGSE